MTEEDDDATANNLTETYWGTRLYTNYHDFLISKSFPCGWRWHTGDTTLSRILASMLTRQLKMLGSVTAMLFREICDYGGVAR